MWAGFKYSLKLKHEAEKWTPSLKDEKMIPYSLLMLLIFYMKKLTYNDSSCWNFISLKVRCLAWCDFYKNSVCLIKFIQKRGKYRKAYLEWGLSKVKNDIRICGGFIFFICVLYSIKFYIESLL